MNIGIPMGRKIDNLKPVCLLMYNSNKQNKQLLSDYILYQFSGFHTIKKLHTPSTITFAPVCMYMQTEVNWLMMDMKETGVYFHVPPL